jgi:galactoside 2-L-fucosyltransferase 1/2
MKVDKYMGSIRKGKDKPKIIGIHARRGDHLALGYLRFPPPSYFQKAKNYFIKKFKNVKFIVATNDRKWAEENFSDANTSVITHSKSPAEDMAILVACDGVIMSLGTFGWWGAYLGGGSVVYYTEEFDMKHPQNRGHINKDDYYLPSWKGIGA